jgi:hypothetical protein
MLCLIRAAQWFLAQSLESVKSVVCKVKDMTSGLSVVALGACLLLFAIAAAIDLAHDVPPVPSQPYLSRGVRRVFGWIQLMLFAVFGILFTLAGVLTALFVFAAVWPWTAVGVVGLLSIGIFRISKSLRRPRAPQSLQP